MCQLVASFLLVFPLLNLSVGRPTMMQASRRVVVTAGGQLRAVVISRPGLRPVESFLGVQYATARRFRRPSPSTHSWQGVRVARDFGPVCPQRIPDIDQPSRTVSRGGVCLLLGKSSSANSRHGSTAVDRSKKSDSSRGSAIAEVLRAEVQCVSKKNLHIPGNIPDMDHLTRTLPRGRLQYFRRLVTYLKKQDEDCLYLNLYMPMIYTGRLAIQVDLHVSLETRQH